MKWYLPHNVLYVALSVGAEISFSDKIVTPCNALRSSEFQAAALLHAVSQGGGGWGV